MAAMKVKTMAAGIMYFSFIVAFYFFFKVILKQKRKSKPKILIA